MLDDFESVLLWTLRFVHRPQNLALSTGAEDIYCNHDNLISDALALVVEIVIY